MNKKLLLITFIFSAGILFAGNINKPVLSQHGFIENKGQIIDQNNNLNPSVLYLYNGNGLHVQLKQSGFSYEVWKVAKWASGSQPLAVSKNPLPTANSKQLEANIADSTFIHRIDISFVGANQNAKIISSEPASDYINYYTTGTSEAGVINVHHYKKVLYQNIYSNIDVEFVLNENKFKYNFIIHSGGNPNDIQLKFDGANSTSLTSDGHITIETAYGNIDESIPSTYQFDENNNQQSISANFKLQTSNTFGISIVNYDAARTLIIDPAPWASYYGGSGNDEGHAIVTDANGNVYITGITTSNSAVATSGAYQILLYGTNAFISKFSISGALLWGTYYGGTGSGGSGEKGNAIAVDIANSVYVAGYTSSTNFNVISTSNGFQTNFGGSLSDAFVVKFDSLGMRKWGTYYGGDSVDAATGIALDSRANVYITGYTHSVTSIATSGSFKTSYGGGFTGSFNSGGDAFIVKFDSSGTRKWGTYYGGANDEQGNNITTDANGYVYLTGNTTSYSGIASSGTFQTSYSGGGTNLGDAFIVKFDSSGTRMWASYFGGTNNDAGFGIASDINSNIYITGITASTSGIATSGSFLTTLPSSGGGFIAKFNISGVLQWATYYGGIGEAIVTDKIGNSYTTGYTNSTSGIATSGAYQTILLGGQDAFISKFNSSGTRIWATYFGGNGTEIESGIALDTNNNIFITGNTTSTSNIATTGVWQTSFGGGYDDVLIAGFTSSGALVNVANDSITGTQNICNGSIPNTLIGSTPTGGNGVYAFKWQKSSVSATNGFINAGGNDTAQNYSPPSLTTNTWYRRALASGGSYDTTTAIAITIKLRAGFTINNANQCFAGNSFIFNDTTLTISGTLTRKWYLGAGANDTSILANPTKVYSSFGTYSVKLVATGSNGCTDSVIKTITVYPKPTVGYTINSALQQCFVGNSFGFTDTSTISNGSLTRLWNFSTTLNDTSTSISPLKVFPVFGTKNVKLIISNNGCKDSVSKTVTVYPNPQSLFAINNSAQCLNGNNFGFTDYSIIGSGTMQRIWSFGTGNNDTSTTANPSKIYNSANTYNVKLVQTSNFGCKDSTTRTAIVFQKPTIGFTINNPSQCLFGNNFSFNDTSSILTGSITRLWNFGNGDTSTAINPNKVYPNSSSYSVKLLETSDNGCMDSVIKTVTINPKPIVGFSINNSSQCVNGNNFLFTDTTTISGGTISRQWNFGTGAYDTSSANNPTKVYTSANTYSIKLFANSNYGCKDSLTKTITVNPKPSVGFTINNSSQCLNGNNFLFNDTSLINSGTLTRNWDFGNGANSNIVNPSTIYTSANSYQIKIVSTSNNGCKDSLTKTVIVNPKPNVGFTINNSSQCLVGNSFLFSDTSLISSGTFTRNWDFGNGANSNSINPSITYSSANSYQVKIVSTSNNGCKDSLTKTVTVNPKPIVGFTQNNLAQCLSGNNFVLNDTTTISSGTINRVWNFGDATSSSNTNPNKNYSTAGTYQVKLVVTSNNNCKDSISKIITVYTQPKSGFTINSTSQCLIGNSFSFDDTTSTTATRLWDLGDLTTNSNDTFSKTYSNAGTYNVKLKVNDAHSCSDSITKVVTVNSSPAKPVISAITKSLLQSTTATSYQWYLNNSIISSATNQTLAITQNGNYSVLIDSTNGCSNLSNSFAASTVGIEGINISQNEIKIYPNPATQELFISFLSPQNTNTILIEVIDIKGSKLMSFNETIQIVKPLSIDINELAEGMYFVMVNNKAYKFVKTDK